jgi:hypothetical protein
MDDLLIVAIELNLVKRKRTEERLIDDLPMDWMCLQFQSVKGIHRF